MLHDPLAIALSNIHNAEKTGKSEVMIKPASKLIKNVFDVMKKYDYISKYEMIDDGKSGIIKVTLSGKINKCGVTRPRFSVTQSEFDKFEKRYLPAKDFGILIISTTKGLLTNNEAKEKNIGGRLIAYIYWNEIRQIRRKNRNTKRSSG